MAHRRRRNEDAHLITRRAVHCPPRRRPLTVSEAQLKAAAKCQKEKVRQLKVWFFKEEYELLDWAKSQESTAAYIKALMRAGMERAEK